MVMPEGVLIPVLHLQTGHRPHLSRTVSGTTIHSHSAVTWVLFPVSNRSISAKFKEHGAGADEREPLQVAGARKERSGNILKPGRFTW
jgi:hypothetical protein